MALDATGTPTPYAAIPTYDVNVDTPTGLGFNAAMTALDSFLSANVGVGASSAFIDVTSAPYNAVGNGVADDAAAIRAADTAAAAAGKLLFFPGKNFLIKSQIAISNKAFWFGAPGATITIDGTFVAAGGQIAAITNQHYAVIYNDTTADEIFLHGITFDHTRSTSHAIYNTLWMGNTKKVVVDKCTFLIHGDITNGVSFYASNKHLWFQNSTIRNMTGASAGACMLVRNSCDDSGGVNGATSISEDIHITNNYMESNGADEILGFAGNQGTIRDVKITDNTFTHVSGGSTPVNIIILCSTFDAGTMTAYTVLQNVVFANNSVRVDNATGVFLGLGFPGDATRTKDVVVKGNNFIGAVSSTGTTAVIRCFDLVDELVITGNTIKNSGSTAIQAGINGVPLTGKAIATDNHLEGKFSWGIAAVGTASNNTLSGVSGTGIGIYGARNAKGNTLTGWGNGIQVDNVGEWGCFNNDITMGLAGTSFGIYGDTSGGQNPKVIAVGNIIRTNNAAQVAIKCLGTGAPRIALNTWISTGGTYSSLATANVWTPTNMDQ